MIENIKEFDNLIQIIGRATANDIADLDVIVNLKMSQVVKDVVLLRNVESEFKALYKISSETRFAVRKKYDDLCELYNSKKLDTSTFFDVVLQLTSTITLNIVEPIVKVYERKMYEMKVICLILVDSMEILNEALLLVKKNDPGRITKEVLSNAKKVFDGCDDFVRNYIGYIPAVSVLNSQLCYLASVMYGSYFCPEIDALVKYLKENPQNAFHDRVFYPPDDPFIFKGHAKRKIKKIVSEYILL